MEMASKAIDDILKDLKPFMVTDPAEEKEYQCEKCKDTGLIKIEKAGQTKVMYCPDCKKKRDLERWLSQSGISKNDYNRYKMTNFLTDTKESSKMADMARRFLNDKNARGIGYFGRSGTGKTHICIAICQEMKKEHHYWRYRTQIQRIKAVMYKDLDQYEELLKIPKTSTCLYIDDLFKGAWTGGVISNQDLQIMFDIIDARYINGLQTIVSSEYKLNQIAGEDEAIGSRLYEMLNPYILHVSGKNRRINC